MAIPIFSGLDRPERAELLLEENSVGMINATIALEKKVQQIYQFYPQLRKVLDSGAFQGLSDVYYYLDILEQIGIYYEWMSNLDIIGNQKVSDKNFEFLQAQLSLPLRDKLVWIFQPGGSFDELAEMARIYRFVGIGGIVSMLQSQGVLRTLAYLQKIGKILLQENAQAHIFGLASPTLLFQLRNEAWLASIDNTKWLKAYSSHQLIRTTGADQTSSEKLHLLFQPKEMARNNIQVMQYWLNPARATSIPFFDEDTINEENILPQQGSMLLQYKFTILLQNASEHLFDLFLADFKTSAFEAGDEEDEYMFDLYGAETLEEELILWCYYHRVKDFNIYCDEEWPEEASPEEASPAA